GNAEPDTQSGRERLSEQFTASVSVSATSCASRRSPPTAPTHGIFAIRQIVYVPTAAPSCAAAPPMTAPDAKIVSSHSELEKRRVTAVSPGCVAMEAPPPTRSHAAFSREGKYRKLLAVSVTIRPT